MLKKLLLLFCLGWMTLGAAAQSITNYNFAAYTGTFTTLSGATTPSLTSGNANEGYANAIPIGFEFWYMGVRYTTLSASTNGWLTLGANITSATPANNLTSGGTPRPVLAPLWDDLNIQNISNVTYLTSGTAGSRVFTLQYLNVKWQNAAAGNTMSFQVKLYESTGKIEYIYRQETGALNTPSASIGIAATATGSGQFLSVSNTGTSTSSTTEADISAKPISGNTYSFTSPVPAAPASLIFTTVNNTSMTLNWSDLSSNEAGFVIYRSTDGVNYTFVNQVAANTTSSPQAGLTAATLYYWRIYSVSEGGLSSTALSGSQTASCTPPAAPVVTSPVTYCQNASASALSATGSNLLWGGSSGVAGGTGVLSATSGYVDNNFNNRKTNFTTTADNVRISTVDYYIPAYQVTNGMVLSIYNGAGTIIATSSTTTTLTAGASAVQISNTFNFTIPTAGNYSIGISAGFGIIGADSPSFPLTESTGTINITGVSSTGYRCFNNIQFVNLSSPTAPIPSTASLGSTVYLVSQTVGGCISPQASITVNVVAPNLSQIPASGLIGNYKFSGNANDETGINPGTLQASPSLTTDRFNRASSAYNFNGTTQYVSTANSYLNPTNFTISIWFKTSTVTGGRLMGFGTAQTGSSGQYDRHIYMSNSGQIYFGVYPSGVQTINSALSYNDNAWHMAMASLSASGMALYVDGSLVASNAAVTAAENYTGYWRIGYDNMNGWTSQPSSYFFSGTLDDALIYNRAVSPAEAATLYTSPDGAGNNGPACIGSAITLSATTIGGASYSWSGPNGFTSSSQNPSFTYVAANAGVYTVQVTAGGCTASAYTTVTSTTNAGQWTGNVSTDWATGGNWCTGVVPTAATNVIISSAAVRMPVITGAAAARNLTINSGATLTTAVTGTLSIAGTLTNNGTMTNSGTTVFNGTSQQTFSGVTSFTNLTVSNTTGLLLPASITVSNTVTIAAGLLVANNFNIAVGGSWVNNTSATAFTAGTGIVTFSGTVAQNLGGTFSTTFNNLVISPVAVAVTLTNNVSIAGNLTVSTGIFDIGAFTANRTASGGVLLVANNATMRLSGATNFPLNFLTVTLSAASTVEYAGTAQTVAAYTYGNIYFTSSSGAVAKSLPAVNIVGNLTTNAGAGSVTINSGGAANIGGNVVLAASTTWDGGSAVHSVGGNWTNAGTFTGNASTMTFTGSGMSVSGAGAQNFFNLTVTGALVNLTSTAIAVAGNLATTGSGSITQSTGATLTMSGASKTISGTGIVFENLTITGTVTTASSFAVKGNISVTAPANSFTASAGTVTMTGASKTISGSGTKSFNVLSITGTVSTAVNFTVTAGLTVSGTFTGTAGAATFAGTSVLSGTANLFDVIINGTSMQMSANAVLGIAGTMTVTAGTFNATSSVPNTVNFNGAGQTVNALTYSNLILSNGNTKTAGGAITVNNLTIAATTTFIPGTLTHTVSGNWTNNGTFTAGSSTIQFAGTSTSYIFGATTFNVLTSNTSSATTELILQSNVSATTVNMTKGVIQTGSNTLTITGTRTGPGYIYGTITRTHTFNLNTAYAFEGPDNTVTFTTFVVPASSVTVNVVQGAVSDFPYGSSIGRQYTVTANGIYVATLRLHYEDAELNGNNESTMGLWRTNSTTWTAVTKTGSDATANYVEVSGQGNIAYRWTLSGSANVVRWKGGTSSAWATASNWEAVSGSPTMPPGVNDVVYLGDFLFTNNPVISTPVSVKNILFADTKALSLSLTTGGSLTTGDIRGSWPANSQTHSINAAGQNITINGNLVLSDGTAGHVINLSIGAGTVAVNGSLTQSGSASVIFSGAGNLSISDDFTYTNGTFTPGTGTVTYNGSVNQTIGAVSYYNLTINKSAGLATISSPLTAGGNLRITAGELNNFSTATITGSVTISSGAIFENSSILHIGGDWINQGSYVSNGSVTNVIFEGSGPQSISATTFDNLEFNKPVGSVASLTGAVTLKGNLVGTSGTLDIGTYFFNRDVTGGYATLANAGTLIIGADNAPTKFASYSLAPSSTVIFNGSSAQNLTLPGLTYGNVTFRNVSQKSLLGSITVNGTLLNETGSTLDGGSSTITLNGDWQNNGIFQPASSIVVAAGSGKNIIGNTTFNRMTVTGSYTIQNDVTYNGLLNITSTGSLSGGNTILTTMKGDLINSGVLNTLGTTTFTGLQAQTLSLINAVSTVAVTVNFNGSVSPVLNSTSTPQYGFLNINNTGGVNPSVDWNILNALTVGSGASFNTGSTTQNIYGSVTNNGTITSSGVINLIPVSPTVATINLGSSFTSTGRVEFGGTGTLTLSGPALSFNNVVVSNSNAAGVAPAADWTIAKDFTLNTGSILNATVRTYTIGGDLTLNGTFNAGTSNVILNGSAAQNVSSSSAFYNFRMNTSSANATLLSSITVNNVLNFTSGKIITNALAVIIPASGSVTGASSSTGWVAGLLQKNVATGATSRTFETGDVTNYTPLTFAFASVTTAGSLTVSTMAGDHPSLNSSSINPSKSVNRYWTITPSGLVFTNYTLTTNWVAGDVDAGSTISLFKTGLYNGSAWVFPTAANPTALSIQATGVTTTGDVAVGENCNSGTTIAYPASPYCSSGGLISVTRNGNTGGTYSSTTGLSLNASTGGIDPALSTPGTYTVTYTLGAAGGCPSFFTTASITITGAPSATISYSGTPYCSSSGTAVITLIGTAGGSYSSAAGLSLNASSGAVNLAVSTAGSYTVTYTVAAANGCAQFTTNTSITITTQPYANGSYEGNPYCSTGGVVFPTGTAQGMPGTLSSTAGLVIDSFTGGVDLGASTAGTYTVTYSVPASGGCAAYSTTSTIAITPAPSATISYAGTPFCTTVASAPVTFSGSAGGSYSSTTGLTVNAASGTITPTTSTGGMYTVTYTMAASNGCPQQTATADITITQAASATIAYSGSPYFLGSGTAAVTLTGTTGGNYTSTAGIVIDIATGEINLVSSTPGTYTVTYTVPAAAGCPLFSTTANVTLAYNVKVWDGGAGTSLWGDANNWNTNGVPTATDDIDLSTASTINVNVAANARNLILNNSGLSLTVAPGSSLTVAGDVTITSGTLSVSGTGLTLGGNWTNNGTFVQNTSTVTFNGAVTQQLKGSAVTDFYNLTLTNTSSPGVTVETNQNLRGVLTLAPNATFDADGTGNAAVFTLMSEGDEPTQDASIGILPTGAVVQGKVTVRRFMTRQGWNNQNIYRYISTPVQNATVADIQNEIPVTGAFTGSSTCTGCRNRPSMFYYDETVLTDISNNGVADLNDGYLLFPVSSNTETLTPGRGYTMYTRGEILASTRWDVRGPINAGNITPVTLPVSYTSSGNASNDGWNFVGNPYPSTIDWNSSGGWTKTNLDAAIYITDNGSSSQTQYATWNGVTGTNGGSRYISSSQGFWVKANGSGTPVLHADELVKVPGTQTIFFREAAPENIVRITLAKESMRDETVIHFRNDATGNFDGHADARKLYNGTLNISSVTADGTRLAINSLGSIDCATDISLALDYVTPGTYTLNFTEWESFSNEVTITLEDKLTGQTINIREEHLYEFTVNSTAASFGADRLVVHFTTPRFNVQILQQDKACQSGAATLRVAGAPANGSYNWYSPVTSAPLAGQHTGVLTTGILTGSRDYYAAAVNAEGCEGEHARLTAEVLSFPDAVISGNSGGDSLLSNFSKGNQWYFNDELIPGATGNSLKPLMSGRYSLTVSIENCTTSADYDYVITGAEDPAARSVTVFPNPAEKEITVLVPASLTRDRQVRVLDSHGQPVGTILLTGSAAMKTGTFDTSPLPSGVYLLQITGPHGMIDVKLIHR